MLQHLAKMKQYLTRENETSKYVIIESIKTTSMEDVSTGVLEKIKDI